MARTRFGWARRIVDLRFALTTAFAVVVWFELLSPFCSSFFWEVLHDEHLKDGEQRATRILLVADPQLIGYRNEPPLIGPFSRWDADRYLSRGFYYALLHGQPDAVFFMGDLFDEGVESDEEDFSWALQRFNDVFPLRKSVQRVFISGDNDVGGESENVLASHVERFDAAFENLLSMNSLALRGVAIQEVNMFNGEINNLTKPSNVTEDILILLSHAPIVRSYSHVVKKVMEKKANLLLTAHDHKAIAYVKRVEDSGLTFKRIDLDEKTAVLEATISKNDPTVEIQTPTCSYRMGVPSMGYGLLTLRLLPRDEGQPLKMALRYTVLWLPGRYPQLFCYATLVLWMAAILVHRFVFSGLRAVLLTRRTAKRNIV